MTKTRLEGKKLIAEIETEYDCTGNIDLSGTKITSLPEGLKVGGFLDLSGAKITSLPEGLKVRGSLDIRETKITSLPEGLEVGGFLDLSGTKIKKSDVPKHLISKCYW